jgi:predicted subunit of tRNA(5-methylaminomethyl-2-thiouridylate) methyltransferase
MGLALLYSGGKDSTLAALILDSFYEVTLLTAHFGVTGAHEHARETAGRLGMAFRAVELDREVATAAAARVVEDGFPRNGIQDVHDHALETVAGMEFDAVADGTRRDDRVPTVSRARAQSIEDRHGVDYVAPLWGFGRGAVDRLAAATLHVESGPSEDVAKGDYEAELRAVVAEEYGRDAVDDVFPEHVQTRVTGRRE